MINFYRKYKTPLLLTLILLSGFFLRVSMSADPCLHKWDERFHALVAKNILKHPLKPTLYENPVLDYDYTKWYSNHVWLHKPPLPLWTIALSYQIFGTNEFATRIPSLLLSLIGIYITFLLGKHLFSEEVGLLSAFFFSINGLLIEMAAGKVTTDHYDTFFLFFIEIAILMALNNASKNKPVYAILTGIFLGMALLTKWLPALIVIPVHVCFLLDNKHPIRSVVKYIFISLGVGLLIAMPWQIYIFRHYPLEAIWESNYNWLHFTQELEGHTDKDGFLYYLHKIRINYSELIYIPLLYFLYTLKTNYANFKLWAVCVWALIPVFIFSFAKMKLQGYILFTAPAWFMITAYFYYEIKHRLPHISGIMIKTGYRLVLLGIIVLPLRYCFERTSFGMKATDCEPYTDNYKNMAGKVTGNAVVLNVKHPVDFMFYVNCSAYPQADISEEKKKSLQASGFKVYYYNDTDNTIKEY